MRHLGDIHTETVDAETAWVGSEQGKEGTVNPG